MFHDLKDKTALITGCGRRTGIGYAIAEKLAQCGTHTILTDLGIPPDGIDPDLQKNAADLTKRFNVQSLACAIDVTSNDSIQRALQVVKERFDRIDFLFNNAGAVFGAPVLFMTTKRQPGCKRLMSACTVFSVCPKQ